MVSRLEPGLVFSDQMTPRQTLPLQQEENVNVKSLYTTFKPENENSRLFYRRYIDYFKACLMLDQRLEPQKNEIDLQKDNHPENQKFENVVDNLYRLFSQVKPEGEKARLMYCKFIRHFEDQLNLEQRIQLYQKTSPQALRKYPPLGFPIWQYLTLNFPSS